ncbi:MAG: hypothetical protein HY319_07090 [Armatimonadetes bacterium]|nr:hypothetical protein [Armatimonadota bacterium]
MGLALSPSGLYLGTRNSVWYFCREDDALFRASRCWITDDVRVHDVGVSSTGVPLFVKTLFNCLVRPGKTPSARRTQIGVTRLILLTMLAMLVLLAHARPPEIHYWEQYQFGKKVGYAEVRRSSTKTTFEGQPCVFDVSRTIQKVKGQGRLWSLTSSSERHQANGCTLHRKSLWTNFGWTRITGRSVFTSASGAPSA